MTARKSQVPRWLRNRPRWPTSAHPSLRTEPAPAGCVDSAKGYPQNRYPLFLAGARL